MVHSYGFIDLIVKSAALEKNYGGAKAVGKQEGIRQGYFDSELICFPLGMNPFDAENEAKRLSSRYHFSLPANGSANNADSVVIEMESGPTTECNWLERIKIGSFQLRSYEGAWNPEKWLQDFNDAALKRNTRPVRVQVYKNTQKISEQGKYTINGKEVNLEVPGESTVYEKEIVLPADIEKNSTNTIFEVVNEDCLETARRLQNENPLLLNMANRQTPGGGVVGGAGAQEECLFRSSNYFQTLYEVGYAYPMNRDFGGIYSPDVTVFRDLESNGYALLEEPFKVSFVAVSAINNPALTSDGHLTKPMEIGTINKIKTILNIAVLHGHKTLILSALGCGAFHNPPEDIACLFKKLLQEEPYYHYFEKVVFAIKKDHNDIRNSNFKAFEECFCKN